VLIAVDEKWGYVLTAWHVVKQRRDRPVCWFGPKWACRAAVIGEDRANDVAVLQIEKPDLKPMGLAIHMPAKGTRVWLAGFAHGASYEEVPGKLLHGLETQWGGQWVATSANTIEGVSGGPMLNARREVVGLVVAAEGTRRGRAPGAGPLVNVLRKVLGCAKPLCGGRIGRRCQPGPTLDAPLLPLPDKPPVEMPDPPLPPAPLVDTQCRADIAALTKQVEQLTALVQSLAEAKATPGPPGRDGKDGADGADAVVNYDRVRQIVQEEIKKLPSKPADTASPAFWNILRKK
jgi:hypothetical protein